jgi:allantoin racemase
MRRILVVNPNTSAGVTTAFVRAMEAIAPKDVVLTGVTGTFGAKIVTIEAENTVAAYGALDLIAKHAAGCDAVILAISFDSGLSAARSVLSMPVVGITEAAVQSAIQGGRRIGAVFFGEASRRLYEDLIASYGVKPVGCLAIDIGSVADYLAPEAKDQTVLDAVQDLVGDGAEAVVICGAAIVGMAARLQARAGVPLYDGLEALEQCLAQIEHFNTSDSRYQAPIERSSNISPELAGLIAGALITRT